MRRRYTIPRGGIVTRHGQACGHNTQAEVNQRPKGRLASVEDQACSKIPRSRRSHCRLKLSSRLAGYLPYMGSCGVLPLEVPSCQSAPGVVHWRVAGSQPSHSPYKNFLRVGAVSSGVTNCARSPWCRHRQATASEIGGSSSHLRAAPLLGPSVPPLPALALRQSLPLSSSSVVPPSSSTGRFLNDTPYHV